MAQTVLPRKYVFFAFLDSNPGRKINGEPDNFGGPEQFWSNWRGSRYETSITKDVNPRYFFFPFALM